MRDLRIQADLRSFQISHSVHVQAMASTAASNDATLLLNSSNTIQPTASGQSPKSGECAPRPRRHIDSQITSGGPNTDQTFSNQAQPYSRNALRAEAKNSELSTVLQRTFYRRSSSRIEKLSRWLSPESSMSCCARHHALVPGTCAWNPIG